MDAIDHAVYVQEIMNDPETLKKILENDKAIINIIKKKFFREQ